MSPGPVVRLAVLAPHVVQYHAPVYRALAARQDLAVHIYYESRSGLDASYQPDFNRAIGWDVDLTGGYDHSFLPNRGGTNWGGLLGRFNPGLIRVLSRRQYDAVLIQGCATSSDWLALIRARFAGLRVLYRGEGVLEGRPPSSRLREAFKRRLMKFWLNRCDTVLYSCAGNRRYFEHFGMEPGRLRFMPCCVDNEYFQAQAARHGPRREHYRSELGIGPGDLAVGMFAKLINLKRPFDLLEAAAALGDPGVVVVFVGDGPERAALERRAAERGVRSVFAGFVNQSELGRWYAAVDAVAVISDYDASPKAANEAMNFGLPIIASDVVGTAGDLLVDGDNAVLVPPGEIASIAGALERLKAGRPGMENMGRRSLERVQRWSPAHAADSIAAAAAVD